MCILSIFFFQAEDGIRDLVRSRGLGDVYKRQGLHDAAERIGRAGQPDREPDASGIGLSAPSCQKAVSYTHLTLPTSDLV